MNWLDLSSIEKPIENIDQYMNYVSKWPLFVHMASATLCLGFSALYHLFFVYSKYASSILMKLDFAGIIILIFGSTMPSLEYLFACNPVFGKIISLIIQIGMKYFFIGLLSFVSLGVFIVTMMPLFARPDFKWLRGLLFIFLGVSISSPLLYVYFFQ